MRLISKLSRICKIYLFLVIVWLCTTMVSHCKILFLIYTVCQTYIELLHKFMKFMFCREIVHFNKLLLFWMLVLCFVAIFKTIMIEMKKKTLVLIRCFLWTERKQTTTSGGSCLTPTPAASITTTPPVRKPSGTARKTVISSPLPSYR